MSVASLILPPLFGFGIGFVTNALAIRMLFRPYDEVRVLGLRFQGMIPRRKADIARTVAGTVASELLREERVAERLVGEDVREALRTLILDLSSRYLDREYGSLAGMLGAGRAAAVESAVGSLLYEAAGAAEKWAGTAEGARVTGSALEAILARSPGELLRGEEALVAKVAVGKGVELLAAPDLEGRVRSCLGQLLVRLVGTGRPVGDYLPDETKMAFRRAVAAAVPPLLRRFEKALLSPENVQRIKGAVRSGIEAYLLETEGGWVKNMARQAALLGRERIFREVDEIVDANLFRLGELVYQEETRARLEAAIEEALDAFLAHPPAELIASLPADSLDVLYGRAAQWICAYVRRPEVAQGLAGLLEREVDRLFETPLRELLRASGAGGDAAGRWAGHLARWVAEGGLRDAAGREIPLLARELLAAPLGRPARFLPPSLVGELAGLLLDHLMPVAARKVPEILAIVDVKGLIEGQILEFSPREVEEVILSVARRELTAITWWGGVLGAAVGAVQVAISFLF